MGLTTIAIVFFLEESKPLSRTTINGVSIHPAVIRHHTQPSPGSKDDSKTPSNSTVSSPSRSEQDHLNTTVLRKTWGQRHALYTLDDANTPFACFMWHHISQPFLILIQFPAAAFAALQYGWTVSMLSVLAVTQATLYPYMPYNFSSIGVGNMSIPAAIGGILGTVLGGPVVDYFILRVAKRRGGIYEPETRLWLFLIPGLSMTIGCSLFGLTISQVKHLARETRDKSSD